MESYRIQLFLHILAAILAFGPTFVYPFLQGFAERRGAGATRFALQFIQRIENIIVVPGALLVALFGTGLIFDDRTGYKDDFPIWLAIAVTWFAAAFVVSQTIQRRAVSQAVASLRDQPDDAPLPDAYRGFARQIQMIGGLLGLSVIGITFMMVWGAEGGF
jgi:hypothetical protein